MPRGPVSRDLWTTWVIVAGLALRVWAFSAMDIQQDGNAYAAMGHALVQHGGFWMPWGDGLGYDTAPGWSHHFAPMYPAYLAGVYSLIGFGVWQTKLAALIMGLVALVVVGAATWDLYGRRVAVLTVSLFSVLPRLIVVEGTGFSENLALCLLVGTLWAIVKSTKKPRFILFAGLFAGLSYLTRTSTGPFLGLAALGGVWWRVKYHGWRSLTSPWYLGAGALAAIPAAWWMWRNYSIHGDFTGSNYHAAANAYAMGHPIEWAFAFFIKLGFFLLLLYLLVSAFKPEWRQAIKARGEENVALWLTLCLLTTLAALISAAFWTIERTPLFWLDAERYLLYAYVPLLWLLLKDAKPSRDLRARHAALGLILALASVWFIVQPTHDPTTVAASHLDLESGDTLGIQGASLGRYNAYLYLPTQDVSLVVCQGNQPDPCGGAWPHFILGREPVASPAYNLTRTDATHFLIGGSSLPVYTYTLVKP